MTGSELVRISLSTAGAPPEAVAALVRGAAERNGVAPTEAELLGSYVEIVCRNVLARGFESGADGRYEVSVRMEDRTLRAAVEDRGLPFDYDVLPSEGLEVGERVRFVNLGRGGNRVEISAPVEPGTAPAPDASPDAPDGGGSGEVEIRRMDPGEAVELTRAVYRSYGYSYDWDDIYYPERIAAMQRSGAMRSVVAVSGGEIVGHLAVMVEGERARVGEAGQAVVDPRFRGHRLFERLKTFAADEAREAGLLGLYSEATAAHPYSQKGNLHLGARETGFLLGYIPSSVAYKEIGDPRQGRRGSVALFYMRAAPEPHRRIHAPERYREIVGRIVEYNGLDRTIVGETGPRPGAASPPAPPDIEARVREDHNTASVAARRPGPGLADALRPVLESLVRRGVDCVYVDLPLSDPGTGALDLAPLGLFFGGVLPEGDPSGGDLLRLQYLNTADVDPGDVHTASETGRAFLDYVLSDMPRDATG